MDKKRLFQDNLDLVLEKNNFVWIDGQGIRALEDIVAKSKSVFVLIFPAIEIDIIALSFFLCRILMSVTVKFHQVF